ncbi:endonuclease [Marinomonas sp. E8]|uniref:Endonuclease n=2 Tax=Marinomonas algarum TaxID=2883105 RepID=A0A9X1IR96_9GAMM|nr:endonuclease [Marinomonas algarum]
MAKPTVIYMFSLYLRSIFTIFFWLFATDAISSPISFSQAKVLSKQHVYFDQTSSELGTFYCGCDWRWVGQSGGRVNKKSCDYKTRKQEARSNRTEWEHVVPAWVMGHQRQCWQDGGRKNCSANDPTFRVMEADPHNLVVSVGEPNADRSNYSFGMIQGEPRAYGSCDFEVDFKSRVVEPRPEVRGQIARIYFYIHDRYDLNMSKSQQQLLMAWNKTNPVTDWEKKRDARIANAFGHSNPFVTGDQVWRMDHVNSGQGLKGKHNSYLSESRTVNETKGVVRGNKNSRIYHLSSCPSYGAVKTSNIADFKNEEEAQKAGYRKAKNCP